MWGQEKKQHHRNNLSLEKDTNLPKGKYEINALLFWKILPIHRKSRGKKILLKTTGTGSKEL